MTRPARVFRIRQGLSERDRTCLPSMTSTDFCFYRFAGGNISETERLVEELSLLKATGVFLVGVFRFPFRFEGKKRMQTAITQYYEMMDLCETVTYLVGDGMLESIDPNISVQEANHLFEGFENAPTRAIEELILVTGDMNIDVQDIQTFLRAGRGKGPVYIRTVEGEDFDEPLKYILSVPFLAQDYADGEEMLINIGYAKEVNMQSFQQMNLRLTDLFHKADLFKLGTYQLHESSHRFKITILVRGIQHPFPRPDDRKRFRSQRRWIRQQLQSLRSRSIRIASPHTAGSFAFRTERLEGDTEPFVHFGTVTMHRKSP